MGYVIIVIALYVIFCIGMAYYSARKEIMNKTIENLVTIIIFSLLPEFSVEDLN